MFVCKKCGEASPVWTRRYPVCDAEMPLEKQPAAIGTNKVELLPSPGLVYLPSGFPFFDWIFWGGFLQSFLYFIHAEKGAGKTMFLLQVCTHIVSLGYSVLFFCFDESLEGIKKKTIQYGLADKAPCFIGENSPGILEHAVLEYQPDFAVADSLQSLAGYNSKAVVNTLVRIQAVARKHRLPLIVVGEERKDRSTYLGSAHISHIVEVIMKLEKGLDDEVIISTPEKNRDTDDRTSRCFFKRTPSGLVEIAEPTTGYLPRHTREAVAGLASFVTEAGNDYAVDEVTAIMEGKNSEGAKFSLSIEGMAV